MSRFLLVAFATLTIVCVASTAASAFQCVARSSNGAAGFGGRLILERAQYVALRSCAHAGGNAPGHHCHIVHCRP